MDLNLFLCLDFKYYLYFSKKKLGNSSNWDCVHL
ncbi:unnamed protein product [Spirodela intermedia]|uniref:Uncharacterized protein n=1 Tax=Spirodela intermedia TaxID=51605 RepID=A0A7I8LNZ0_SPIIN|nr:unnamed protein product [Spirodela intermedia]